MGLWSQLSLLDHKTIIGLWSYQTMGLYEYFLGSSRITKVSTPTGKMESKSVIIPISRVRNPSEKFWLTSAVNRDMRFYAKQA